MSVLLNIEPLFFDTNGPTGCSFSEGTKNFLIDIPGGLTELFIQLWIFIKLWIWVSEHYFAGIVEYPIHLVEN